MRVSDERQASVCPRPHLSRMLTPRPLHSGQGTALQGLRSLRHGGNRPGRCPLGLSKVIGLQAPPSPPHWAWPRGAVLPGPAQNSPSSQKEPYLLHHLCPHRSQQVGQMRPRHPHRVTQCRVTHGVTHPWRCSDCRQEEKRTSQPGQLGEGTEDAERRLPFPEPHCRAATPPR